MKNKFRAAAVVTETPPDSIFCICLFLNPQSPQQVSWPQHILKVKDVEFNQWQLK